MPTMERPLRALVADDNRSVRQLVRGALELLGHEADECDNAVDLYGKIESEAFPLLILDSRLGGLDALRILSSLRTKRIGIPVIFMSTRLPSRSEIAWCLAFNIQVMLKPFPVEQMIQAIRGILPPPP